MIEFFIEDPRARLLAVFTIVIVAAAAFYRFFIWGGLWRIFFMIRPIPMSPEIELSGLRFVETCSQSPEQYDVYFEDRFVGYVRYRFGILTAEYPDVGVECVFERELAAQTGQMTDHERGRWLPKIARKLRRCLIEDLRSKGLPVRGVVVEGLRFEPVLGPGSERYFILEGADVIGFVEFRQGVLRADYPDEGFETVFEKEISKQDGRLTDQQRQNWFPQIAQLLRARAIEDGLDKGD